MTTLKGDAPGMVEQVRELRRSTCYPVVRAVLIGVAWLAAFPAICLDIWAISLFFQDAPLDAHSNLFGVAPMSVKDIYLIALLTIFWFCIVLLFYQIASAMFDLCDAAVDISRKMPRA